MSTAGQHPQQSGHDHERLFRAVERFGTTLESAGFPRMAARVFAYVLAEDRDHYTARELAEGLEVSPAAISGAVRYLVENGLLLRQRQRGGRGDVFSLAEDDIWGTIMRTRLPALDQFVSATDEAAALLPDGSRGQQRLTQTREFFRFMRRDLEGLITRWQQGDQPRS